MKTKRERIEDARFFIKIHLNVLNSTKDDETVLNRDICVRNLGVYYQTLSSLTGGGR